MSQKRYKNNPYPEDFINVYDFTLDFIIKNIPLGSKIIDVGCSNGILTSIIKEKCYPKKLVGIDVDQTLIQIAHKMYNDIEFIHLDGEKLHNYYLDEKFDVIFLRNTFHHFKKKAETLKYYKEVLLEKNGVIIIIDLDNKSNFSFRGLGALVSLVFSMKNIGFKKFVKLLTDENVKVEVFQ